MQTFATLLVAVTCGAGEGLEKYQASQAHMGTLFEIVLFAESEAIAQRAMKAAYSRIAELDQMMSDYVPDSELNKLSRLAPTPDPVVVSRELIEVLGYAKALSVRTNGAFDVTVGPLSKLWRRARRRKAFPSPDRLAAARAAVGHQYLKVHRATSSIELTRRNMRLDLGAIAKGYAGDEAIRTMRSHGVGRVLVNAGGDIVAGDAPPNEKGWRIGIAPLEPDAVPSRFLRVANAAVATSGDAWQYVEIDGQRYSHILDPRTGLGLAKRSSVTVMAPSGLMADSLASAVSVLGEKQGRSLIEETPMAEALIVRAVDGKGTTVESSGFSQLGE